MSLSVYEHPITKKPISGVRLGRGAVIRNGDVYDSTTGDWAPAPAAGITIRLGNVLVWVRTTPPSATAMELLQELCRPGYYLVFGEGHWRTIPHLAWKHRQEMDWRVATKDAEELAEYGFTEPVPEHKQVYRVSAAGREYFGSVH